MAEYYIGLMSGTSMDGIDVALVDFSNQTPHLVASVNWDWPKEIQSQLRQSKSLTDDQVKKLNELDNVAGLEFAKAAMHCMEIANVNSSEVIAIGCHGQTLRHRPHAEQPFSLQIGNAKRIVEETGIDVITDFRTADIDAGGEGAPLAPAFHQAVFSHPENNRVILNIGGIANLTVLNTNSSTVIGFDSGPGNGLMDAWIYKTQQKIYDNHGHWAEKGTVNAPLLDKLLGDDYLRLPPPKSTGFEHFNLSWLENQMTKTVEPEDVQATLCEYTAITICDAIKNHAANTDEVFVCGGGAYNIYLMHRLQDLLDHIRVESTEVAGIHPDWVEAMAFAWLARQQVKQLPGNIPSVTGAKQAVVLGQLTPA